MRGDYHLLVMKNITTGQLKELFLAQKGAAPITFSAMVDTRARKTGNPYDKILKFSVVNGFIGFDYETSVNRQQVREGNRPTFIAHERKWGENINNVLVEQNGKFYLSVRPLHTKKPVYFGIKGNLMTKVEEESIKQFLPNKYDNRDHQGVRTEIVYRNYSLESIRYLTFNKVKYKIIN